MSNKYKEAIAFFKQEKSFEDAFNHGESSEYYTMAITAIQEKQERENGCEFCDAEYAVMSGSRMTADGIHKGCTAVFCPMCGRELHCS